MVVGVASVHVVLLTENHAWVYHGAPSVYAALRTYPACMPHYVRTSLFEGVSEGATDAKLAACERRRSERRVRAVSFHHVLVGAPSPGRVGMYMTIINSDGD